MWEEVGWGTRFKAVPPWAANGGGHYLGAKVSSACLVTLCWCSHMNASEMELPELLSRLRDNCLEGIRDGTRLCVHVDWSCLICVSL